MGVMNEVKTICTTKAQLNVVRSMTMPTLPKELTAKIEKKLITVGDKLKPSTDLKTYIANQINAYLQLLVKDGSLSPTDVDILKPKMTNVMYYQRSNSKENKKKMINNIITKYLESVK